MSTYATDWKLPGLIKRGDTQTRSCPVYVDGTLTSPYAVTPGTYTLYDETGTKLVDAQAVTIASSIATYEVQDTDVPTTKTLSDRYLEVWDLNFGGSGTIDMTFKRDCHLVLDPLECPFHASDLADIHSEVADWVANSSLDLEDIINAAWVDIQRELLMRGKRPWLILSAWVLFPLVRARSGELFFRDCHAKTGGGGEGKYLETAEHYKKELMSLWGDLQLVYDKDEDGFPESDETEVAVEPVVMAMKPGRW